MLLTGVSQSFVRCLLGLPLSEDLSGPNNQNGLLTWLAGEAGCWLEAVNWTCVCGLSVAASFCEGLSQKAKAETIRHLLTSLVAQCHFHLNSVDYKRIATGITDYLTTGKGRRIKPTSWWQENERICNHLYHPSSHSWINE